MDKQEVDCPVCGNKNYKILFEPWVNEKDPKVLYGAASGIQGTQTIVRCIECMMIYENPRYPSEIIIEGYKHSEEEDHDSHYHMRVKSFYDSLYSMKALLPPRNMSTKILDIGTAGGAFLHAAEKFGYDAYGMEPSDQLVSSGQKRGLKIQQGLIENNDFEEKSFDIISLWDVIEHLTDPKDSLQHIKKLLKDEGILLINYPDIGSRFAKLFGKKFWWILSVHLHHFDKTSIKRICDITGYETFHFQRYWQTLEFGYLEEMAAHLKVPLARFITDLTPKFIKKIPFPYYAAQTTCLARLK